MNKRSGKAMRKTGLLFLACLLINIFLAAVVDVLTFRYRPGHGISGNGNPGVIVLIAGGLWKSYTVLAGLTSTPTVCSLTCI